MLALMQNIRGWEIILLVLLALLLFGGFKKLPDAARGIGRSLRIFKAETKGLVDDDEPAPVAEAAGTQASSATDSVSAQPEVAASTDSTPTGNGSGTTAAR